MATGGLCPPPRRVATLEGMSDSTPLTAADFVQVLEDYSVTHVMGIPDGASAALFDLVETHPSIRLITVSREGEAFSIASGVWVGGGAPLVVVQNTGLLESGDALRGTAMRMAVPLPIVVTGRGYARMETAGLEPDVGLSAETLVRPDVDSVALHTEPTLRAWSVPFRVAPSAPEGKLVADLIRDCRDSGMPAALVLTAPLA